ncbi:hypothetical protein F53441_14534, partial [Fusarium austroafricanum]
MSRWYPVAATAEECKATLADLHQSLSSRAHSSVSQKLGSSISHVFDRLQLWCFSFDVEGYALDQRLRQSASLAGMVLDLLDKLKSSVEAATKEIPRFGSIGDGDIEAARLHISQSARVIDMLFNLSQALQNPALTSPGPQSGPHGPIFSALPELRDDTTKDLPSPGWRTVIVINSTITCKGSRWEEVGALLTHILNVLAQNREAVSFVQFTQGPAPTDRMCNLRGAIEHVRAHQPTGQLLGATKFDKCLSSIASQLQRQGETTSHSSLIFIVPDGILHADIKKTHRAILQKSKMIREENLQLSSLIISFVVVEPNQYILGPLLEIGTAVNEDWAAMGTVLVRIIPYFMLSASEETNETILRRGVVELQEARRAAVKRYTENAWRDERTDTVEGLNRILISPISTYTQGRTVALEFGRFGHVESVVIEEGKQRYK